MILQVQLGVKHHELLLLALLVETWEVVLSKVLFQSVVIQEVLRVIVAVTPVAQVTSFVGLTTMREELVSAVEPSPAEATFWVSLKSTLVYSSWDIVSDLLVSFEFCMSE